MKLIVWIISLWMLPFAMSQAASFDCTKAASSIEKLICDDDDINKLDGVLSNAYQQAIDSTENKKKITNDQIHWLHEVRDLCTDINCLKAVYQERIIKLNMESFDAHKSKTLSNVEATDSNSSNDVCEHFQKENSQLKANHQIPGSIGRKVLCFDNCKENEISASQFWGDLDTSEKIAIRDELIQYENTLITYVTEVDINGDGVNEIRLARLGGTLGCVSDMYLMRTKDGYKRISSPSLNNFSGEGSSCGSGSIFFSTYNGKSYAVNTFYNKLTSYEVDKNFNLKLICTAPSIDSFSVEENVLSPLPKRIESAIRRDKEFNSEQCKLIGKPIELSGRGKYYAATTGENCNFKKSQFGLLGPAWIIRDEPGPVVIFSGIANSIFVRSDSVSGLRNILVFIDRWHNGIWQFDGARYVVQ